VLSRPDPSNLMPDVVQLAGAKTSPAAAPAQPATAAIRTVRTN